MLEKKETINEAEAPEPLQGEITQIQGDSHKSICTGKTGASAGISAGTPSIQKTPVEAEQSNCVDDCSVHIQVYDQATSSLAFHPISVESEITIPFEGDKTFLKPNDESLEVTHDEDQDKLLMPPPSNPPLSPLKFRRRSGAHLRSQSCPAPISRGSNHTDHQRRLAILREYRNFKRCVTPGSQNRSPRRYPSSHKTPDMIQNLPKLNELLLTAAPVMFQRRSRGVTSRASSSEGPGASREILSPTRKCKTSGGAPSLSSPPSLRQLLELPVVPRVRSSEENGFDDEDSSSFPQKTTMKIPVPMLSPGSFQKQYDFQNLVPPTSLLPLTFETPQSNLSTLSSSSESQRSSSSVSSDAIETTDNSSEAPPGDETCSPILESILKYSKPHSSSTVRGMNLEAVVDCTFANQLAQKFYSTFNKTLQKDRLDYMTNEPLKVPRHIWKKALTAVMLAIVSSKGQTNWTPYHCFDQLMCTAKWILGGAVHFDLEKATYFQLVELERCFYPQHKFSGVENAEEETSSGDNDILQDSLICRSSICPATFVFSAPQWKSLTLELIELAYSDERKVLDVYQNFQRLLPPRKYFTSFANKS